MAEQFQLPLPMWQAQYHLLGGHRRMAAVAGISAVVLVGGIFGVEELAHPKPFSAVAAWVLNFLAVIQGIVVLTIGPNAVHRAMLRDYETKMIESHRLTPMSNLAVTLGYLFGSTIQIIVISLLITVAGAVVSAVAGLNTANWLTGNFCLLNGAITFWSAVVFFGLRPEKPASPLPVVVLIGCLTFFCAVVPVAGLLLNVYPALFGFWLLTGTVPVSEAAVVIVAAVNVTFTVFWIAAAAVKYRRPDLPALNGGRGLVFLLLLLVTGTIGMVAFDQITRSSMTSFFDRSFARFQWIATMIGTVLLASVPIAGAVKCRVLGTSGTALRGWSDRVAPSLVAIVSAGAVCLLMGGLGQSIWETLLPPITAEVSERALVIRAWAWSGVVCLVAVLSIRRVFEIGYLLLKSPKFLVGAFFLALWALPPVMDSMRALYARDFGSPLAYSWLMGCSPAGTIVSTWSDMTFSLGPGLGVQMGLLVVLEVVARRARRRLVRSPAVNAEPVTSGAR